MAGSLKDRLPNRALSGPELAEISRQELKAMLVKEPSFAPNIAYKLAAFSIEAVYVLPAPHPKHELHSKTPHGEGPSLTGEAMQQMVLDEFDRMVKRDYVFGLSGAYRSAVVTLRIILHVSGWYQPAPEDTTLCVIAGEAPLNPLPEQASVVAIERIVRLENPNIDRINHGLPIIVQRATPPQALAIDHLPGEAPTQPIGTPGVENLEYRYDATQFPAPPEPVDSNVSQQAAARMGVPVQVGAEG